MYVREDCTFEYSLKYVFHYLVGTSVPGGRYVVGTIIFFGVTKSCKTSALSSSTGEGPGWRHAVPGKKYHK